MNNFNWRGVVALLACLLIVLLTNLAVAGKEKLLAQGRVVYLQLATVDPRSLMQGDYMALNYQLAREVNDALSAKGDQGSRGSGLNASDGRTVVRLDERSVASFSRLEDAQQLAQDEILMRYRVRNGRLRFASNGFFFREGTGDLYQDARYGMFRVDARGELLLTHLCDENLRPLGSGI